MKGKKTFPPSITQEEIKIVKDGLVRLLGERKEIKTLDIPQAFPYLVYICRYIDVAWPEEREPLIEWLKSIEIQGAKYNTDTAIGTLRSWNLEQLEKFARHVEYLLTLHK